MTNLHVLVSNINYPLPLCCKVYVSPSTLYHKTGSGHRVEELMVGKTSVWMDVSPGSEQAFDFTTRRKIRHMASYIYIYLYMYVTLTKQCMPHTPALIACRIPGLYPGLEGVFKHWDMVLM